MSATVRDALIARHGSRGVNFRSLHVLARRGLLERYEGGGFRMTEAGRGLARSLKGELSPPA